MCINRGVSLLADAKGTKISSAGTNKGDQFTFSDVNYVNHNSGIIVFKR